MSLNLDKTGWKRVTLGDVASLSKEKCDPSAGDVDRYVAGEHMETDNLRVERWGVVGDGYLGPAFHRRFRPGQVLFGSRRTYLRKVALADFDGVCANTTFVVEADSDQILPEFLPFVMTSGPFQAHAIAESKGSVNPYVNWSDLTWFEFYLPPLDEQKRMVDLLWSVDRHGRAVARDAAATLSALRLWRAAGVNNQSVTPIKAAQAFEFSTGVRRTPDRADGPHMTPYLRSANVGYGKLDLSDVLEMNYSPDEQARFSLLPGDVLVTEGSASASAVGMPARWNDELPGPVCFQMTLLRLRAVASVCIPEFVFHWSMWAYESGRFLDVAGGTNIKHISAVRSSQMAVHLPSLVEQQEIVSRLESMGRALECLEAERESIHALRSSLLADIFGGAA